MRTPPDFLKGSSKMLSLLLLMLLLSCKTEKKEEQSIVLSDEEAVTMDDTFGSFPDSGNLVLIRTENMDIIMPDTLPSGWTTFRYKNESDFVHLILLDKLPVVEGKQIRLEDMEREIVPVFQNAMNLINQGKQEEGYAEFGKFPEWISQITYTGGIGLLSEGETTQVTLKLEPGHYVLECYVKTGGQFHNAMGMATELVVTEEMVDASPPPATVNLNLSAARGFEIEGDLKAGPQTIAVHFEDQKPHENMVGHDVHLAKLADDTDMEALEMWMNWAEPRGLETSTVPAKFIGGVQDMPAGNTAYFSVDLEPGKYALIAEVPNASKKNMLKVFDVEPGRLSAR